MHMSYWRFAAMIGTSTVVMFGLMYLNTYALEHVRWSETRMWMALLMGATMAFIMLSYMLSMYTNKKVNIAIFAGSALVFGLTLWLVRSQATISDVEYMEAMIPHHSIAILTSERAQITDPRVRKLADEIIAAQRREISEMQYLVQDLEAIEGIPAPGEDLDRRMAEPPLPEVVPAGEALQSPNLTRLDLETMEEAEAEKVVGQRARCSFAYSRSSSPTLAASVSEERERVQGVAKLHGRLVELEAEGITGLEELTDATAFTAEGIRVVVVPLPGDVEEENGRRISRANLHFELEQGLQVGYKGWLRCDFPDND